MTPYFDNGDKAAAPEEFRVGIKVRIFNWSLDRAIKAKGWKRPEAAKACGVHFTTLNNWLGFKSYPKEAKALEVAVLLGVSDEILFPEEIKGFRITKQPEPVSFGREEALALGLCSQEVDPEEVAIQASLQGAMAEAMQGLREREKLVVKLRFGLEGEEALSLRDVGAILGVTSQRIRVIEATALRRIRHPSWSGPLRTYLGR